MIILGAKSLVLSNLFCVMAVAGSAENDGKLRIGSHGLMLKMVLLDLGGPGGFDFFPIFFHGETRYRFFVMFDPINPKQTVVF